VVKGLDKQVYIYSVDTSAFYTDEENKIHMKLLKLYRIKKTLTDKIKKLNEGSERKQKLTKAKKQSTERINKLKSELITLLNKHQNIRSLREDSLKENAIIGMFDSALTRTIGMKTNQVSKNLLVVRVYYYQILKELIKDGFVYNGEKYIFFSSSAGQIRTKKGVWIKESLWQQHEAALTCGLSIDEINQKGGCNVNKLLAYKALTASASTQWYGFDIDKTIVVPDLETNVNAKFDFINRDTYEIIPQDMSVPIEHTDGCGIILPKKSKKAFMVRLPYVKGLLVPFSFDQFAKEYGNTKVTDLYGKEWDVIEDDIHIIFTASQFKMKKYYSDWNDYKTRFKENKCQAVKLNEEDLGEETTLNYQMLQTLTDVTNAELKCLAEDTSKDILKLGTDKETMLRILGATKTNNFKNYYQEALMLYPELLNDEHSKKIIKEKKKSMIMDAVSGKLKIHGRYIYLIPDLYAFCERLFLKSENPKGLLNNGEVFCKIYNEGKLDILRSPHLYKEHSVRKNTFNEERSKWFITNGIYTSIFDPISRILQCDFDGDKANVIQDELFIEIAERNMRGILPLYYEMSSANATTITNEKIYDSLLLAFKANIGEVSNNITKVFNSDNIDLRVVKWLTAENNYIIDFAKSLYMPKRPEWVDGIIKGYIKSKVPYFFIEAKDKEMKNVEPLNNSTVNRLRKIIPNKAIKFEKIAGKFNYKLLMSDTISYVDREIIREYRKIERSKQWLIRGSDSKSRKEGELFVYKYIRDRLKEINPDEIRVVNVLVEELYGRKKSPVKTTLWNCYGDILLSNLRENLKGTKQCECCGERVEDYKTKKYCEICAEKVKKESNKIADKRYKEKKKREKLTINNVVKSTIY
jgi:RNA dependent RNA polymerase